MATNIQKEAQRLFGNPASDTGLVTFDPESYSRALALPGTEDISGPSPLSAIATAETRTYSPPTRSISTGLNQSVDFTPAFISDINVAAPDIGDQQTINDIPGLENVNVEAQKSLGIFGLTPTSLTKTFNNLTNLNAENLAVNALNVATANTPIAGLLGVADKALSGAFNKALSTGNLNQIAQLGILANNLFNIDLDKISDIPGQVEKNIESLVNGLAAFVDAPLETLQDFVGLAGTYAQYGTMAPELNSFTVNGIEQSYVTNEKGEVVTTPGFAKAIIGMSPLSNMAQAASMIAGLIGGETAQEKAAREMANMEIAAQLPSFSTIVDVPQLAGQVNMSVTSVPDMFSTVGHLGLAFTDIVSIEAKDIPGLNQNLNINLAEYGRTGTISGAVIGNVYDPIGYEEMEIADQVHAALDALAANPNSAQSISRSFADAVQAVGMAEYANQMSVPGEEVDFNLNGSSKSMYGTEAKSMAMTLGLEQISNAIGNGQINSPQTFASFVGAIAPEANLGLSAINTELGYYTAVQAHYQHQMSKGVAMGLQPGFGQSRITDPEAIAIVELMQGEQLAADYNSQTPSFTTIEAMDILGYTSISMNAKEDLDKKRDLARMEHAITTTMHSNFGYEREAPSIGTGGVSAPGYEAAGLAAQATAEAAAQAAAEVEAAAAAANQSAHDMSQADAAEAAAAADAAAAAAADQSAHDMNEAEANTASIEAGVESYDIGFGFDGPDTDFGEGEDDESSMW